MTMNRFRIFQLTCLLAACVAVSFIGCGKKSSESKSDRGEPIEINGGDSEPVVAEIPVEQAEVRDEQEPAIIPVKRSEEDFRAGSTSDVNLVRLYADAFSSLDRKQRVLAYHLARAVLAGRDIAFDQMHPRCLEIRQLLESILKNNVDSDPNLDAALSTYLNLLWVNGGFYDNITGRKFVPSFSFEEFERAAQAANAMGAELGVAKGESLEAKLSRLKKVIFDPDFHPTQASPKPRQGRDILKDSHLNLYSGVTMRDVSRFKEKYPQNSRLVRIEDRLVEEVYRAGDKMRKIARGRYYQELRRVIRRLQDAMTAAKRKQRKVITELVEHFRIGDAAAFEHAIQVLMDDPSEVEFFIGFTDTGLDPRGTKGIYSGMVGILDKPNTSRIQSLARQVQYFEDTMPWDAEFRKHWGAPPLAVAVQLLVATRRAGPVSTYGWCFSPDLETVSDTPGKTLVFSNVIDAERAAVGYKLIEEFVDPANRDLVRKAAEQFTFTSSVLRLVFGDKLGRDDGSARRKLMHLYPLIQSLKAELVSLWLLADPKLEELDLMRGAKAAYLFYLAQGILQQALIRDEEIRRPETMAQRIVMRYLKEKAKVFHLEQVDGLTYPVIPDVKAFREAIARLLKRSQKILGTSDKQSALRLLKAYSGPAELDCVEEWTGRAAKAGLRKKQAFVVPKLKPQFSPSRRVTDVSISYDESFKQQMMRYRSY
jgi:dipeptidyl-peptidase III